MKFCIDCIHYEEANQVCLASAYVDMVSGQVEHRTAGVERMMDSTGCGKDARLYKPMRPTIFAPTSIEDADLDDLSKIPFGR